jgi:asparagine synthase (glutamine-hydrolysing)
MTARGPDAKGQWYSDDGRLGIGHRRLSIIDLSAQGVQPMLNARRNLVLSFNGEIYNYKALRALLEKKGRTFHTATDTEVILKLYEEQGEAMLGALRGMFSLVIWDAIKGKLLLARDPYGIKPLYYANDGWTIRIASQVKALLAGGRVSRQIDPAGHVGFFLFGSVPEPYTSYQEIREVPPGAIVEVGSSTMPVTHSVRAASKRRRGWFERRCVTVSCIISSRMYPSVHFCPRASIRPPLSVSRAKSACAVLKP